MASTVGHDPDGPTAGPSYFGDPIWFGGAERFQVRTSEPVRDVRVHFVTFRHAPIARTSASYPLAQPVLDAGPGQPPIIARAAWAADHATPAVRPAYGTVRLAFVHHTDNPNGYRAADVPAMLLAMYDFHRFVRGWADIGYNFVIDAYGRVWEAREGGIDEAVIGAQAGGYNFESTGVAVLGTFASVVPSRAAVAALEHLLAWKLAVHGIPAHGNVEVEVDPPDAFYTRFAPGARVWLPRVAGHRDGCTTDCPGDAFYAQLPSIRRHVTTLAGAVASVTLGRSAPLLGLSTLTTVAGTPLPLSGRLMLLGAGPIAGAPIEIQTPATGGAKTLATSTSESDGSWTASVTLLQNTLVRAIHRLAPATTSELTDIEVAPAIMLSLSSRSPLRATGTVTPQKRHVTITLYALRGQHRRRLATERVTVRDGRYSVAFRTAGAGSYELRARTGADAHNIAGSSPPLAFSI